MITIWCDVSEKLTKKLTNMTVDQSFLYYFTHLCEW